MRDDTLSGWGVGLGGRTGRLKNVDSSGGETVDCAKGSTGPAAVGKETGAVGNATGCAGGGACWKNGCVAGAPGNATDCAGGACWKNDGTPALRGAAAGRPIP